MTPEQREEAMQLLRNTTPKEILFRLLFGECRGQPIEAQVGVGSVVRNRTRDSRWSDTWQAVCLQPKQFSCFNPGDPNFEKLMDPDSHEAPEVIRQLKWVASGVVDGLLLDNVAGANHYYDFSVIVGQGQERDLARLSRYLKAVNLILTPNSHIFTSQDANDKTAACDLIHTLVKDLPPRWDEEVLPVARKGRLIFFRL
jgi:hypothetical protein